MKKSTPQYLTQQNQDELGGLLSTNKCLAMQKKEFHRQKLRVYSEKTVKIRVILRETTDPDQKKCLEAKLKALQEKQDAEITKLAKIDQIEKQIDGFIDDDTEENNTKPPPNSQKLLKMEKTLSQNNEIQGTPALRLRTKSSVPSKHNNKEYKPEVSGDNSRKRSSFSKKIQPQQQLLADSRQALEQIQMNNLSKSASLNQQKSKLSLKSKQMSSYYPSFRENGMQLSSSDAIKPIKAIKIDWSDEEHQERNPAFYEGVPQPFVNFVDKVSRFWPKDIEPLIEYFKESEIIRNSFKEIQQQFQIFKKKQQKLKQDQQKLRKYEDRVRKLQQKQKHFIVKERTLLQKIDTLQKEEKSLHNLIDSSILSIKNSATLISQSSFAVGQHNDPITISCFHSDSAHKFSVQSFEQCEDGSIISELSKFEKGVHQYLLSAERAVMLVSGQIQQISVKLQKSKNQQNSNESRKRILQQQLSKVEQSLAAKKGLLKQLEQGVKQLQQEVADNGTTVGINRSLAQQLEEKCEKLKSKKKSLSERVKGLESEVQSLTIRKQNLFETVIQIQQKMAGLKAYEKELQTKMIFLERDKENRQKDIQLLEQKGQKIMQRLQESNKTNEQISMKINQQQLTLAHINTQIQNKNLERDSIVDKARKLQQQLLQSNATLQSQSQLAQEQANNYHNLQGRITQAKNRLKQIQTSFTDLEQKLTMKKNEIQRQSKDLQEIIAAKSDLQSILRDILLKKQQLILQVQERSKQLELVLSDLQTIHEDSQKLSSHLQQIQSVILKKNSQLTQLNSECQSTRLQLDEQLQEEANIVNRLFRLKEVQRTILIGIGVKGGAHFLDQELKMRVEDAVGQLSALNQLKRQLKDCKYECRKLKLQNQRLNKLVEG